MIRIILVMCLISMPALSDDDCPCPINYANNIATQQIDTTNMIRDKESNITDALDDYADALDEKIAKMKTLLKTMRHAEALMKTNQVRRRQILKLWDNTAQVSGTKVPSTDKSKERRKIP